jgi:hypothetical protein
VRGPLTALSERFRRRPEDERGAPREALPRTMALGAEPFQTRLDEARERLRRDIPPPPADDE